MNQRIRQIVMDKTETEVAEIVRSLEAQHKVQLIDLRDRLNQMIKASEQSIEWHTVIQDNERATEICVENARGSSLQLKELPRDE